MQSADLRARHPTITYRDYSVHRERDSLRARFHFLLDPDIRLEAETVIPCGTDVDTEALRPLFFHLGMVELISYWKAACPPLVRIEAGPLDDEQISWWRELFMRGLGEFFFTNSIDFTSPSFLRFEAARAHQLPAPPPAQFEGTCGDLVLVGGGKDSIVSLELLKSASGPKAALIVKGHPSAIRSAELAGYARRLIVSRTIDPTLLELNRRGYLNGHTPFSAYLAFVGVIAAAANGLRNVIVSNEAGSDEPNAVMRGLEINHQYSKTHDFERRFRNYCRTSLTPSVEYFSFLRPLLEIQISSLFARFENHLASFRSCNVKQKTDAWCCACPKCAFVALSLAPFLGFERLTEIFGSNPFTSREIGIHIRELTGLEGRKPFECVGTVMESIAAVQLACGRVGAEAVPDVLREVRADLAAAGKLLASPESVLLRWNSAHELSAEHEKRLKAAVFGGADGA